MERSSNSYPSFIKLLIEDDFTREIRIPTAFVRDFKEKFSPKCKLISEENKSLQKSWSVRIRKKGRYYYICRRSWPNFVQDHELKLGDYLVFNLIDATTFQVKPYGADCCQKKLKVYKPSSSYTYDSSSDSFDDDSSGDSDENDDDDDFSLSKVHPARPRNYGSLQVDLRSNKSRKMKKSGNSGFGNAFHQSESQEEIVEKERDGDFELNTENPYFIMRIKKHHRTILNIPRPFSRGTKLELEKQLVLRGQDMRQWPAKIIQRSYGRTDIATGWSDFRKAYNLEKGETCRFTLLKRYGNLIHVQISRTSNKTFKKGDMDY